MFPIRKWTNVTCGCQVTICEWQGSTLYMEGYTGGCHTVTVEERLFCIWEEYCPCMSKLYAHRKFLTLYEVLVFLLVRAYVPTSFLQN